jgi:iron complex transport system substrate-binding protein
MAKVIMTTDKTSYALPQNRQKQIDIRKASFTSGEPPLLYRLPASTYMYVVRGSASVLIDEIPLEISGSGVIHGGKGMTVKVLRTQEILDYYLILYRSTLTLPARRNLTVIMERSNPFTESYNFTPGNPLPLYEILAQMYDEWQKGGVLEHLHAKTLFYQWIHELLRQLHAQDIQPLKADPLDQAVRYMHDCYSQPFTLDTLAGTLGTVNPSRLKYWPITVEIISSVLPMTGWLI